MNCADDEPATTTLGEAIFNRSGACILFVACCLSAFFHRGTRRAFWLGVVGVLLLSSIPSDWYLSEFSPDTHNFGVSVAFRLLGATDFLYALRNTLALLWTMAIAGIAGWISATIYKHAKGEADD